MKPPYEWRKWLRSRLPWVLIDLGIADKGKDCEAVNAKHQWYNQDNESSHCYYCKKTAVGQLWKKQ